MSLLVHIDNEVGGHGQWDAVVQAGSSTIVQTPDAAFPERGRTGLRAVSPATDNAYVQCDIGQAIAAEGTIAYSLWFRLNTIANISPYFINCRTNASDYDLSCSVRSDFMRLIQVYAGGVANSGWVGSLSIGRWYHVAVVATRANALGVGGGGLLYLDGALVGTTGAIDNHGEMTELTYIKVGWPLEAKIGNSIDIDQIRVGTTLADVRPTPSVHRDIRRYPDFRLVQADVRLGWRRLRRRAI